jgi:hypothetical protein
MVKFSSLHRILFTFNVSKKIDEKTDLLRQEAEIVYIFPITRKCWTAVQILYAYGNLYEQNFKKIPILWHKSTKMLKWSTLAVSEILD